MTGTVLPPLQATIDPTGVVAPLERAVRDSVEMVALGLSAIKTADLTEAPSMPDVFLQHVFKMDDRDSKERSAAYSDWLLSKGYQEVARATREMLEEAYLYIGLYATIGIVIKGEVVLDLRRKASRFKFPDLLARVNAGLSSQLKFAAEMLSLQKVRNCLEHRGGIVGDDDLDVTGKLRLVLPTLAPFAREDNVQVELYPGYFAKKDTNIVLKRISREREYSLGERVLFTAQEFNEIAHSCWLLSQDLLQKLPHPSRTEVA